MYRRRFFTVVLNTGTIRKVHTIIDLA